MRPSLSLHGFQAHQSPQVCLLPTSLLASLPLFFLPRRCRAGQGQQDRWQVHRGLHASAPTVAAPPFLLVPCGVHFTTSGTLDTP